jgi:hypothetical protein
MYWNLTVAIALFCIQAAWEDLANMRYEMGRYPPHYDFDAPEYLEWRREVLPNAEQCIALLAFEAV